MLDIDLVRGKTPVAVDFCLSLAYELVQALSRVVAAPFYEGFDQWVYATHAALPADLKAEIEVVLLLLEKAGFFFRTLGQAPSDDPVHHSFSAFFAWIDALSADEFRGSVEAMLEAVATYLREHEGLEVSPPSLDDVDGLRAFLGQKFAEEHLDRIVQLMRDPAELKARTIATITRFWEQYYREEYERALPLMQRSVTYHQQQNYTGDFPTVFTAVTGRLLPDAYADEAEMTERAVFMPSCHIGPYVAFQCLEGPERVLLMTYNCRPTGVPEGEQLPAIQDLFPPLKALADETRLQILSMLSGRELYAQQIVDRLDISQSAVSRHLQLMVAGGVLVVRKEDGMKFLSVNEETLAALADRLRSFRHKPPWQG